MRDRTQSGICPCANSAAGDPSGPGHPRPDFGRKASPRDGAKRIRGRCVFSSQRIALQTSDMTDAFIEALLFRKSRFEAGDGKLDPQIDSYQGESTSSLIRFRRYRLVLENTPSSLIPQKVHLVEMVRATVHNYRNEILGKDCSVLVVRAYLTP